MSSERDDLRRLVEELPDEQVDIALAVVRRKATRATRRRGRRLDQLVQQRRQRRGAPRHEDLFADD